jgi:hypothetical protein
MKNIFTQHPNSLGESYWKHLYFATKFGSQMMIGGAACVLHAVFPFMFKNTGSNFLLRMTNDFINRMDKIDERVATIARSIEAKR